MWSAPADSKLCFRLTKTGRFNGKYAAKPSPQSSGDRFVIIYDKCWHQQQITGFK